MLVRRNVASSPAAIVCSNPRTGFDSVTVAPGSNPPCWSTTVPVSVAVVCAVAPAAVSSMSTMACVIRTSSFEAARVPMVMD
jgi:hypothetical protein